ncbi:pyruvate, phosphate dikinase [Actinobaculum suis]|uniref:pyruvate, phosphate dikinase n=1 Tax=Actinobaculum suis TaxID=1657 RepID=UPI00080872E3|nr:pyruvate, phosphate dikinase [Actinobaculum suis]OCA94565.1 pyruvate, phosphate dikinase [Actinobaculum suis]OCA94803.1 pyruvate, phosphate dikinase [Actinobaculum suis]
MTKYIYSFTEGNKDMKDLLGGKGANLAEMVGLGMPVPPGFTITTEACRYYLENGLEPHELAEQVTEYLTAIEEQMGRKLGDPDYPLLFSVRSGAKFSMPGMMDTVLNIGLTDESVRGLAKQSEDERFAWDSYRRLIQMFGKTVLDIDGELFSQALSDLQHAHGYSGDLDMTTDDLREITSIFKGIVRRTTGRNFPQNPRSQMNLAITAVFRSWNTERARIYRRREHIPDDLGTAVNIQTMVFGNLGETSATGVCFTRDPSTGHSGVYGDFLPNAQGEDVVAGIRNTQPLAELQDFNKPAYDQLVDIMQRLENHYRDLCDIEFTIEEGKLWMLQTRVGKRTPAAAFRVAGQLVEEGLIDKREAVTRVTGEQLTSLLFPQFRRENVEEPVTVGTPASPGAAVGKIVFDNASATRRAAEGEDVILVRRETNPDDLEGMVAAQGVLTARGGKTSHAAVVARGMGRTAVVGAEDLVINENSRTVFVKSKHLTLREGDVISIDGTTGEVFTGSVPVEDSPVMVYVTQGLEAALEVANDADAHELVNSVHNILTEADSISRMKVRANADNPEDAAKARTMGAQGIGLVRTEHMFLGERRELIEHVILAETREQQEAALAALLPLQKNDFLGIFEAMDGLPVVVRLIDPPLHEFLPDLTKLSVEIAVADALGKQVPERKRQLLHAAQERSEANPMLGLRGVRLSIEIPGFVDTQVRAVAEAAAELRLKGKDPHPEIMIPLVGSEKELHLVADQAREIVREVERQYAMDTGALDIEIGTMIELPRAAIVADKIAHEAEFFSFGTNDLTQTTLGFSRDDVEHEFIPLYIEKGIFQESPFGTIDQEGVGELVRIGVERGREGRPGIKIGVCGEHGGDPQSIHFFDACGIDYVSCSPFRVPIARLEAGRATVHNESSLAQNGATDATA